VANQRGGSEWEPIKIILEGDRNSNKTNTASNTRLRLTTQVDQVHAATGVLLNLRTNSQPHRPENAAEHQNSSSLTNTGQTGEQHRSDWPPSGETWRLPQNGSTPVRPVQHTGQIGLSQKTPKHQTGLPSSKLTQTRNNSNKGQQRTHPNVHPSKNPTRVAPVRPVKSTGQIGVACTARDEQHPRVNSSKSKLRSPETLHRLQQDFGDNRNTS
jgi:hypothetical protein